MLVPDDDAEGFAAWARDMRMILRSQDLAAAATDAGLDDAAAQRKAVTAIYFSVTTPFRAAVEGCATAPEAFDRLEAKVREFSEAVDKIVKGDK